MLSSIARNWWLVALRGVLALIFGIVAFVWPGLTLDALVLIFGAYALVDGVLMLGFGLLAAGEEERWWPLVLAGFVGIAAGFLSFLQPAAIALAIVYVIGAWALVTGVLEVVAAIRLRSTIANEWLMGLTGVLSIVLGVLVLAQPRSGALALVYLIALYAVLAGISQISLGFRLRGFGGAVNVATRTAASTSR